MPSISQRRKLAIPGLNADWLPPLLVGSLLIGLWLSMFERAHHDDDLVVRNALVNHGNVALAVGNHIERQFARLRYYDHVATGAAPRDRVLATLRSALDEDQDFLRLMRFDKSGKLLFSTGGSPEPWLLEAARVFAASPPDSDGEIHIGTVPEGEFAHTWSLPLFYRDPFAGSGADGFLLALLDLSVFPDRFAAMQLGRSGEIVLLASDGRELLRLHDGRLDARESDISASLRFRKAFAIPVGTVTETLRAAHERLYAHRRVSGAPVAVLVSRTRYDVLLDNRSTQRGYWLSALLLTLIVFVLTLFWLTAARRRHRLVGSLAHTQEENARLIAQLDAERQTAFHLASHDKLTGLANRMLFADIAGRYVARSGRMRSRFAILFIDLDRFKPINDTHGHKAGDQLLVAVARRLRECIRQADFVARYGGDEFVALVSDLHGPRDAEAIAAKIVARLSEPYDGIVTGDLSITPSIGIALFPDDAVEIETLLRQADTAMYRAKGQGRASYAFADPALNRRQELHTQIETALPTALRNGEIVLHYQPKVALDSFALTGLEALARWHHPQLGPISPADFIAVAEKSGTIIELGESIIMLACAQLARWREAGVPLAPVAVNVSPLQLRSPRLFDCLTAALEQHAIPPHLLELEITETGIVDTDGAYLDMLRQLDGLGIRLAIDDFGTGFSGLSHLRLLPVSKLKIDRSFIKDIRNDIHDAAIVSSTISLCHNLQLKAIAEGVELPEQVAYLRANGCDEAQGYFFSAPLPAEAIVPILRRGACHLRDRKGNATDEAAAPAGLFDDTELAT